MAIDSTYKPTEEELELLQRWYAPDVSEKVSSSRTNAFGMNVADLAKKKDQLSQKESGVSVEDVEQSPGQLSAQELEAISEQAKEQGFEQGLAKGKEQGIAQGYEEGYSQGVEQGIDAGRTEGLAQAQSEIDQKLALLDSLLSQLNDPIEQKNKAIEQSLVNLSLTLAKKVIHSEVTQNPQPLQHAIGEALNILGTHNAITVKLHPEDMTHIQLVWDGDACDKRNLNLIVDPSLNQGNCLLESATSAVTLDLEQRCSQVFDDFVSQQSPVVEESDDEP